MRKDALRQRAAVPFSISLEAPGVTAGSAAVCMLSVTGIEARY